MQLHTLPTDELLALRKELELQADAVRAKGLSLDMARGKPSSAQVDLSRALFSVLETAKATGTAQMDMSELLDETSDSANYGDPLGLPSARKLGAYLLGVSKDECIASGSSSLNLMFDCLVRGFVRGWGGELPHAQISDRKFLCPAPGYDRHFALTDYFGYKNISVPMTDEGPDMDLVEDLVENDTSIKGIWCVPKYSNPGGVIYSDEVVERLAHMRPAAPDFKIYWDNAYGIHDLYEPIELNNIFERTRSAGNEGMVIGFASTSKVTIPGSGIAFVGAQDQTFADISHQLSIERVCPNKVNQLAHVRFLSDTNVLLDLMKKHAEILRPRFELVISKLQDGLGDWECSWAHPRGGYFVSFETAAGQAREVVALAKDLGVTLTQAGATWPYGLDPKDSNIRIAPSYPSLEELDRALDVFVLCVKLVAVRQELDRRHSNVDNA